MLHLKYLLKAGVVLAHLWPTLCENAAWNPIRVQYTRIEQGGDDQFPDQWNFTGVDEGFYQESRGWHVPHAGTYHLLAHTKESVF
jgi:hypothetical protein